MKGFTLIELIAVIIILGIVSITAAPRFISLRQDATIAALQGMKGALQAGSDMAHIKAQLQGKTVGSDRVQLTANSAIRTHSGYAIGNWNGGVKKLINLDIFSFTRPRESCSEDWCGRGNQTFLELDEPVTITGRGAKIWPRGYQWADKCAVYYINNENGTAAIIGIATSEC